MKRMFTLALVTCAVVCNAATAQRHPLPRVGTIWLPEGWREIMRGTNSSYDTPHYWVTFQKRTNELLSFLIRAEERPRDTNTIHFADATHELFPYGYYWESRTNTESEATSWPIRLRIDAVGRFEALFASYVTEDDPPTENRMAHGCVLFGEHTVFVQHTSTRPITTELIESVAWSVMHELEKVSPPDRLRLFRKREDW